MKFNTYFIFNHMPIYNTPLSYVTELFDLLNLHFYTLTCQLIKKNLFLLIHNPNVKKICLILREIE